MVNLLAPMPDSPEHVQVFRDQRYPRPGAPAFVGDVAAATPDPIRADRPGPSTSGLEREARWVCEWWPPD